MNTNELLATWSTLSLEEIEAWLEAGTDDKAIAQLFGPKEAAEMNAVIRAPRSRGAREAVVLLPGIMGSLLTSIRGVTTLLWINPMLFVRGQSRYLELDQNGDQDASPEIKAIPLALEKLTYTKIALALRKQCELYEYPYDWRRPIEQSGDLLHDAIERWAGSDDTRQFTLVAHSMGGLVSQAYIARHSDAARKRVKRLITHGTPYLGSVDAIVNLASGNRMMDIVNKLNDNNATRRLMLNLPSLYQLLPAPPTLLPPAPPPANWDIYRAGDWQVPGVRQDYLDAASEFYQMLANAPFQPQTFAIAGYNVETAVTVQRSADPSGEPHFESVNVGGGSDSGDGTVPLWSAAPATATAYYVQEEHGALPKNTRVIQATLDLIYGREPNLPKSVPSARPRSAARGPEEPAERAAETLRTRIQEGTASEQDLAQLYFAF